MLAIDHSWINLKIRRWRNGSWGRSQSLGKTLSPEAMDSECLYSWLHIWNVQTELSAGQSKMNPTLKLSEKRSAKRIKRNITTTFVLTYQSVTCKALLMWYHVSAGFLATSETGISTTVTIANYLYHSRVSEECKYTRSRQALTVWHHA